MIKKLGSAIASAALVGGLLASAAFADNSVSINNNGAGSDNTVNLTSICTTSLVQKNKTNVNTNVDVSGYTGGNTANGNTGGDVDVDSGDVTNSVTVTVGGSKNTASDVPDCCVCQDGSLNVNIDHNGANTNNTVNGTKVSTSTVKQKNKTKVKTKVKAKGKTGRNKANNNTDGNVDLTSGNVDNTVDVTVGAPSNTL